MSVAVQELPRLEAKDFCKGGFQDQEGRRCLMGWLDKFLGGGPNKPPHMEAVDMLWRTVETHAARPVWIATWQDQAAVPAAEIAEVWNKFADAWNERCREAN